MAVGCIDWFGWLVPYLVQITGLLMFWAVYSAPCGQDKEHERKSPKGQANPNTRDDRRRAPDSAQTNGA